MARFDLSDTEWTIISPLFVNAGIKMQQSPEQKCSIF